MRRIISPEQLERRAAPGAFLGGLLLAVFSESGGLAIELDEQVRREGDAADEELDASWLNRPVAERLRYEMPLLSRSRLEKPPRHAPQRDAAKDAAKDIVQRIDSSQPFDLDQLLAPLLVHSTFRVAPVTQDAHQPIGGGGGSSAPPLSGASGGAAGVADPANGVTAAAFENTPALGRTDLDAPEGEDPEPNYPPIAYADEYDTVHDGQLSIGDPGVLENDEDLEWDPLRRCW